MSVLVAIPLMRRWGAWNVQLPGKRTVGSQGCVIAHHVTSRYSWMLSARGRLVQYIQAHATDYQQGGIPGNGAQQGLQ
jgi:hypothetical protein